MSAANGTGVRFRTVSDLEPPLAEALLEWGLALADTKQRMGLRLSEWAYGAAPALEAAVGASAMTQDELGHARSLFAMLRDFPSAPPELGTETDLEDRTAYYHPRALDKPWESWLDVIAVNVLLDRALALVFAELRRSQFGPLHQRAAKIVQEERFHRIFGDSWLRRLSDREDKRAALTAALERTWRLTVAWFGPEEEQRAHTLHAAGVLPVSMSAMRAAWLDQAGSLLRKHGLAVPNSLLEWTDWDVQRREFPQSRHES